MIRDTNETEEPMKNEPYVEAYLETVLDAYIVAALWATTNEDDGDPLDDNYSRRDISEESIDKARDDCRKFIMANGHLVSKRDNGPTPEAFSDAGHDFFMTRQGHGAGFWDGDWPDWCKPDELIDYCHEVGEICPYVGDDGKIYGF